MIEPESSGNFDPGYASILINAYNEVKNHQIPQNAIIKVSINDGDMLEFVPATIMNIKSINILAK